jgi:hypothetical protein
LVHPDAAMTDVCKLLEPGKAGYLDLDREGPTSRNAPAAAHFEIVVQVERRLIQSDAASSPHGLEELRQPMANDRGEQFDACFPDIELLLLHLANLLDNRIESLLSLCGQLESSKPALDPIKD